MAHTETDGLAVIVADDVPEIDLPLRRRPSSWCGPARQRRRRPLRRPGVDPGRAVAGRRWTPTPTRSQGLINYLMRDRHGIAVRAQLDDLLRAGADLRVPRVHAAPHRLLQRGVRPLPRAAPGLLRSRPGAQARAGGQARRLRVPRRHARAARAGRRRDAASRAPRPTRPTSGCSTPGVAREVARDRAAADDLLVDVRDHERPLAHELPVACAPAARARTSRPSRSARSRWSPRRWRRSGPG